MSGHRARRWALRIGVGVVVLALVAVTGGYLYLKHLEHNIDTLPDDPKVGHHKDPGPQGPLNILLLGSDERVEGGGVAGASDDLSDTTILLHLSGDRKRAYGVSIPRDLLVDRPACEPKTGKGAELPAAKNIEFNWAFRDGGANCTWRTVEAMTGVTVNHVVVINFAGFKRMVDALDGVPVCIPKTIDDPRHDIHLKAGSYDISGDDALTYVRARYGIGDGTDIGRIRRQQAFLAAMVNKAVSLGTLINPAKFLPFLEAVTESIQTDPGFRSIGKLKALASQLKGIGLSHVKFLTMPITIPSYDVNRRIPGPGADALWKAIAADKVLTPAQLSGSTNAGQPDGKPAKAPSTSEAAEREFNGLCA